MLNPLAKAKFQAFCAVLVYIALSVLLFGIPVLSQVSGTYIGGGTDPICHIWAIAWWPYAIAHRLNPLITRALWAPAGYNLVWGTAIPGPSLFIFPITRIFGPVVSYNILCIMAPAAAAFTAFLLCHYVGGAFWPALLGGYIFGFSPYMLCHMLGHLVLIVVFAIPLAVYFTLLRIDVRIGRVGFLTAQSLILLFQFLSSTEIFATATVFGGIALVLGFMLADRKSRANLVAVVKEIACAYAIVIVILVPYLYYVLEPGLPTPPNSATVYSNDLFSFVLPPPVLLVGPHSLGYKYDFFKAAPWWEQAGYLGPGLFILILLFGCSYWRTQAGKFLVLNFALIAVMSLGPVLHAGGKPFVSMPWRLFHKLPLIDEALPGRFGMYLFLIAAVAAAIYLTRPAGAVWWRTLLAGSSLLFIAPDLRIWLRIGWVPALLGTPGLTEIHVPDFFRSGQYRRYLERGDNVLVLPLDTGGSNAGMLWQAQSDFYFSTTDWFGAIAPPDAQRWPVMTAFHSGNEILDFPAQLNGFLGAHQVKAIIVDSSTPGRWPEILSSIGMNPLAIGGVQFYQVPTSVLAAFRSATAHRMAEKYAKFAFASLVMAASRYVDRGFPLPQLDPREAQRLKLLTLPDAAIPTAADPTRWQNLSLGSRHGLINVGIFGSYQDLKCLIDDYAPDAAYIFFPFPRPLSERRKHGEGALLITFTPQGLRRAASTANSTEWGGDQEDLAPKQRRSSMLSTRLR